jgi:dihydroorotase
VKTVLRNGRLLDPSQDLDVNGHLVIENNQIVQLGPEVDEDGTEEVYDCTGMWITPGLVDLHVHLREPGGEHKETIISGTQAAAAGGYTTICCMPNTNPPLDVPALVEFIMDRAAAPEAGGVFVAPVGAITVAGDDDRLSDLAALKQAGVVAVSDEGRPIQSARTMSRAMEFCVQLDLPVLVHCEERTLADGGSMNEGAVSAMLGLRGLPRSAEEIMVMRNCLLALHTGCHVHIMRVSTWGGLEMIRQAKYLGAPVTCEVTPHHLVLTEEAVGEFNPVFKTTPPLRTQVDVDILRQGLADGTIDCISSDHSPHSTYEVHVPFEEAPFGASSLESTVGAVLTHVTHKGVLSPLETVRRLSTGPARRILHLEAGTLRPGETPLAQVTVIDPGLEWTFDTNKTFSKGKNNPFHGSVFRGKTMLTFCGGEIYRDALFGEERYTTFD